jgi:hypothetical protein
MVVSFRFGCNTIIFGNAEIFRNYLLEMLKFKEITREGKI